MANEKSVAINDRKVYALGKSNEKGEEMKLSETFKALEEGKTVMGNGRFFKLAHVDGQQVIISWWKWKKSEKEISQIALFYLNDKYSIIEDGEENV